MSLKIKILVIIAVIIAVLAVVFALFRDIKKSEAPNVSEPEPVVDILTAEQRKSVKEFVKNFLSLYNTFAYEDYSNLSALGDYQTQNAQKQTLDRIEALTKKTLPGYQRTVEISDSEIEVRSLLLKPGQVEVKVKFLVFEQIRESLESTPRSDDLAEDRQYEAQSTLRLVPYGRSWLVDDILIDE